MHSELPDRRRATRLDCKIPVLLHSSGRSLRTTAVDLSRVGALVRVPFAELGLDRDIPLAQLGREATFLLGDIVRLDVHYEILGTLIQRDARPVRIGRAHLGQDFIEVGLDLMVPISDMEVEFLGLPLPSVRDDEPATWLPAQSIETSSGNTPPLTVVLCNEADDRTPPLRVVPQHLDRQGARADLGPANRLPVLPEQMGAAGVLQMLAETYGGEPRTVIMLRGEPVWSGAARFSAVEVCPYDQSVRLQLSFAHDLTPRATQKLGVD